MKSMRRVLLVPIDTELAISCILDSPTAPYGMAIETDGENYFLRFWIGQGEDRRFLDPILLEEGTADNYLLHPRAKAEDHSSAPLP